jgi:tetratricopeptide (TPR) repeat protein
MQLLHFDTLERLVLTDFHGNTIPPYAILSHRWGDSEILIEHVLSGTYKEREEGSRKLAFCAKQAAQDNLQYFWIDTCCIDRWNKRERSEAINSMFQWYKNATRCYVFLSDVSVSTAIEPVQRSDWEASFRASAWFTRGWTLQELIAPASVEFFSCEGHGLGDKASLDQLLNDITGIPLAALHNCPLDQFSTPERRRWADNRVTTEEEDIVYCLLGVLGVSMPTTYGEGKESAIRRLQAEVEAAGTAPSIIPFSQNASFVGRELQLAEVEAKLFSSGYTTSTLAIVGSGGTGKSQLALEVAHRTRQNNKTCSVFWIDASDKDSLYQSYAAIAMKLRMLGGDDDLADMKQVVKRCVAEMSTRQCLLIFDNAENTILRSSSSSVTEAADLAECVPQSKLCSAIFTTANSDTAQALAPQNVIALQNLKADTALRILQSHLTRPLSDAEQHEAKDLLRELSYLPIAVVQAAACMNASSMTVQEYRAQLDEHKELAFGYSSDPSLDNVRSSDIANPVTTTLFLSIDHITCSIASAADYLSIAACVDRKDILIDLLEAALPQTREDAVKVLDKYALVTRRPADSALDVHRLVHQALRERLQMQGRLEHWTQHTITQLVRVFPDADHSNRSKWRRLFPHAQYTLSHSLRDDDDKERLSLARKCARALHSDGRYKEAEELEVQVMQTMKRVLGDDHPDMLSSMDSLALMYSSQGRWKEAEEMQVQVVQTRKRVLGDEHPDTLLSMANLALTYRNQGRWKEAEELQVGAMHTTKRVLSDEHPDTLSSMNNLALTYSDQGRWKEAEELQVQLMQTMKRVLGDKNPDTLTTMVNLASTYWSQGRWKEAEELEVQVMQTRKRVLGDEHPHTLSSMDSLALTYSDQGRWKEAEELVVQVMQTRKRVLGDEHPDTLSSMANLASMYSDQGRWKEAEELEVQVMQTRKRVLGDEHPDTLSSIANLASTYSSQGRWKEAEEVQVQVVQTRKRVLGDEHPDTLSSIANLASTHRDQGRWKEAEELQVQVVQTIKRVLGDEHPNTLSGMANLASTFRNQGRWEEAEELEVQVMQTRKRVLGDEHPSTLSSIANLASTYSSQGRWKEAEEVQMQMMQTMKRVLGSKHPDTLITMHNLALSLRSQACHKEAIALMERCLQSRQQVLGEQHPDTGSSLDSLRSWRLECSNERI